jgi:hypothetical protein
MKITVTSPQDNHEVPPRRTLTRPLTVFGIAVALSTWGQLSGKVGVAIIGYTVALIVFSSILRRP